MAFQQPQQRPQAARQASVSKRANDSPPLERKRTIESQEWILFAPAQNEDTASHTSQTPRTATYLSDLGSLETHVRSQPIASTTEEGEGTCLGTEVEDDGGELDSLDDGLRAFSHDPFSTTPYQLDQSGGTLLPTHDGLGTFTSSAGLQEQLWQFERHNPHRRRHVRRRSSLQKRIDEVEEDQELDPADEKMARIEKWRLEQSKAVVDEIEKETRRRQRRMSKMSAISRVTEESAIPESVAVQSTKGEEPTIYEEPEAVKGEEQEPSESWWQRITRRVIQDLIGLDEKTLSVIFGEELADGSTPTPVQLSPLATAAATESRVTFRDHDHSWEGKLMERIAKELGVLVHQLAEHEGAFSTYKRMQQTPQDYAGLPPLSNQEARQPSLRQQRRKLSTRESDKPSSEPLFEPTMPQQHHLSSEPDTSLWGIEEEPIQLSTAEATRAKQEREYWERDIDVGMIFSYLRRRFASDSTTTTTAQPQPTPTTAGPLPASWATSTDSQRRAEQIRRQHPLVSRAAERAATQNKRRDSLIRRHQTQKRASGGSSCASQSTKRSRRSRDAASSRHYWDLGHSATGSVVTSGGGYGESAIGGWGEV